MYAANKIELFTSEHVEEELNKIPAQFRQAHLDIFSMFNAVPKPRVGGLTRMGVCGGIAANPKRIKMNALLSLLPDRDDAWHLFIASSNRISCFITSDVKTIIKHKIEIQNICGVEAMLPSEFLAHCNNEARKLG